MIRVLLSCLLALILGVTSVSAAVMRAQMQGAVQMVICSDTDKASGLTEITLDASGTPIAQPHNCPDCTAALALGLLVSPPILAAPQTRALRLPATPQTPGTGQPAPAATARGPPAFV